MGDRAALLMTRILSRLPAYAGRAGPALCVAAAALWRAAYVGSMAFFVFFGRGQMILLPTSPPPSLLHPGTLPAPRLAVPSRWLRRMAGHWALLPEDGVSVKHGVTVDWFIF